MSASIHRLLVANRGEIALRVIATAAEMGIATVAVYPQDDAASLHLRAADDSVLLSGRGAAAYLDMEQIVAAARSAGCDAVHPGYGFLSESAEFAQLCERSGLVFVGPTVDNLRTLGDKVSARQLAQASKVPVARATANVADARQAEAFMACLPPGAAVAIKAVAGGGGRGIRVVNQAGELPGAIDRCRSEALSAFGVEDVFVEEFITRAKHVEVQVIGDGTGKVMHLGDRECSVQRQRQKLIEIAPALSVPAALREAMAAAALRMAGAVAYRGLGTFEFLVRDGVSGADPEAQFVFLEANPRIQVEHTVTEEVTGLDLVRLQLQIAAGARLSDLALGKIVMRGCAIQARVNTERIAGDGSVQPSGGVVRVYEPPTGPGVRVDSAAFSGFTPNPRYDSLLAKVIVHVRSGGLEAAAAKAARALQALRIEGIDTNVDLLLAILEHPDFAAGRFDTQTLERDLLDLLKPVDRRRLHAAGAPPAPGEAETAAAHPGTDPVIEDGLVAARSPVQGVIVQLLVAPGDRIAKGQPVLIVEAMKMENEVMAPAAGVVRQVLVVQGDSVSQGAALLIIEPRDGGPDYQATGVQQDPGAIRPDLAEVLERRQLWLDAARPDMVARRHAKHHRTARENVGDLCDAGSFHEYQGFVIAAQRARRSLDDLIRNTPADGQICGVGRVNGELFGDVGTQCAVLAYDYSVFAGTQGHNNHLKTDRMLELALKNRMPAIFFAEGGGGRGGDTDGNWIAQRTFNLLPQLSGKVPTIGIASGFCFAGNAAIMGLCDVTIATRGSNIGMGGPVMIEAGGLGKFRADQVGPVHEQVQSGVIDILVEDEAQAVHAAKKYLSYWQGPLKQWTCADQTHLRGVVPQDRRRMYEVRELVRLLADTDSVLELRRGFGKGMMSALIRVEGRPIGLIANDPAHLAGAIDSDAADKAARFLQLCDFYGLPVLSLVDTPGIMVGPEAERSGIVRHGSRLLAISANLEVPQFVVVTRKAYGLGKVGMTAGAFRAARFAVSWPTAEFGPMNLEGEVRLSHRKELEAIADPAQRRTEYERLVAAAYEAGKALSRATDLETDDVIDPSWTRSWIVMGLNAAPVPGDRPRTRRWVDTW